MDAKKRKMAARTFADNWRGRGYEKGEAQVFWTELLRDVVEAAYGVDFAGDEERMVAHLFKLYAEHSTGT